MAVADLYTLTNSRDPLTSSNDFYRLRQYGLYGSIQLDYRRWAFLNITGRNDWSSTLPVDNNSYFYPSVTASVLLSEAFGWRSKAVNYLKIRGGWSQVGADANPYQLATVFTSKQLSMGIHFKVLLPLYESESKTGEDVIYRSRFRGGFLGQSPMLGFHLL